ncbi:MAG: cytochrome P450 [Candidatus Poriferisodalaceae bacterium]|jgi:cytochrome P450
MTDTADAEESPFLDASIRTPEMEMAEIGANVAAAGDLALADINPANPHLFKEDRWRDYFTRLRTEDPVHLNELETAGRFWSVTKYEDVRTVESDWETYSSAPGITLGVKHDPDEDAGPIQSFIAMDPPTHTEQRNTVRQVAAPPSLRNLEPVIRERTIAVLDGLPEGETFDWVETVSVELTTLLLAALFDFPLEDRSKLTRWSDIVFAVPEPGGVVETAQQRVDELMECIAYFEVMWAERRETPGFDLVSMLANGEATKDIPTSAHLGNLLLLIVGGNDTTRNTMSGSVYGMNKFPDQYDKLTADPGLIPKFVTEIIRWQTPLSYMRRTAMRDTQLGGKDILTGDQVLMWYLSANRDEAIFPDGDVIDIERSNAHKQISFGYGIHYCMGSRLAELQLRILWEEALQRFERIELQGDPEFTFSSFVHGYTKLPVSVTRR